MLILILFLLISGCMNDNIESKRHSITHYQIKNSHGTFKVKVQKHFVFDEEGIASFYHSGHTTATNEKFDPEYFTAAHPYLPIPCIAEVSLVDKPWKKIIVKINDRGPFTKDKRILDVSLGAAKHLGFVKQGLAKVRVRVLIKETLKLKEHGGPIKWNGQKHWDEVC